MTYTCLIDNTSHASLDELHAYVKTGWQLGPKAYWTLYAPRKDLCTGEAIPFKDAEQYLAADFKDRNTLKKWLKEQSHEVGLKWAKEWLTKRKESKGLVYAPSQAELRMLCTPSMPYYESVAAAEGGYYGVTAALGFKPRYTKSPLKYQTLPGGASVIQDTREQRPLKLDISTIIQTLPVGDYALSKPYDIGVRIERKSLSDMIGSVGKGGERFARELDRAKSKNQYVVMMVESTITDALSFNYLPQTKWVKATPAYVFKCLRDLLTAYPLHFQVLFVNGRTEMAQKIVKIFQLGEQVKTTDCQFVYENGEL